MAESRTRWSDAVFAVLLAFCLLWIFNLMRGSSFFFDEWDFMLTRGFNAHDLLRPHNGHFSLIPVSIYVLLRNIFGMGSYTPYLVIGLLVHASVSIAVYQLLRRKSFFLAASAGILVTLLGSGWQNILWPFQIGMMGAFSAGLWALLELGRENVRPSRVAILVAISLASAGGGIAVACVVGGALIVRKDWKTMKALIPVAMLYGIWYLKYGVSQSHQGNLSKTSQYMLDSATAAASGIGNASQRFGQAVLVLLILLFVNKIWKRPLTSTVNLLAGFLVITWFLTGLSRAHLGEPGASRYVYVGAIALLAMFSLLLPKINRWVEPVLLVPLFFFLVMPNLDLMRAGAQGLQDTSLNVRAEQSALEQIGPLARPDFQFDTSRAPQISAGSYLSAVEKFGSPALDWADVSKLPESVLVEVNRVLLTASENFKKSNSVSCETEEKILNSQLVLAPNSYLTLIVKRSTQLRFNWFSKKTDGSYGVEVDQNTVYQIHNPSIKGANQLVIEGGLNSVRVCGRT